MATDEQHKEDQAQQVSAAVEDVKQRAASGAEALQSGAQERAEEWSAGLGHRAGHLAEAVRSAGETLRGKEDWLAEAANRLGSNLEELSAAAREKGLSGIKRDMERLARERPVLFMGAAVATGLALGRLLRSAPPAERRAEERPGASPSPAWSGPATAAGSSAGRTEGTMAPGESWVSGPGGSAAPAPAKVQGGSDGAE